jgi:chorismate synthase
MSTVWGKNISVSLFGESHGKAIGVNIGGLPSGVKIDLDKIKIDMARRAPGQSELTTSRNEKDAFQILSGYFEEKTTGTPLAIMIENTNQRSRDYSVLKDVLRPGHADYNAKMRYKDSSDYRGGGHFSGRITAPLVFAGSIAKQILEEKGIYIGVRIKSIANVEDRYFDLKEMNKELMKKLQEMKFPLLDTSKEEAMTKAILDAKADENSVGGVIETVVIGMPPGIGNPFFDSVESRLSSMMFSIPAIKGIEFGAGFEMTKMTGYEANDEHYMDDGVIKTYTNNNGGIIGGITNGMPIQFRVAVKPTASIGKTQKTVNFATKEETELKVEGRHDPCIVPRGVVVVEAATALVILDFLLEKKEL